MEFHLVWLSGKVAFRFFVPSALVSVLFVSHGVLTGLLVRDGVASPLFVTTAKYMLSESLTY